MGYSFHLFQILLNLPPGTARPSLARTPVHPGGLEYPESSSSDRLYAANLRPEADLEPVVVREKTRDHPLA